jgi:hypothetical protein
LFAHSILSVTTAFTVGVECPAPSRLNSQNAFSNLKESTMNAPETTLSKEQRGLYDKFNVSRTDGSSDPGGKHEHDEHFVLNLTTDKHAIPAITAYIESCADEYPVLAADLKVKIAESVTAKDEYITIPACDVPGLGLVAEFICGKYAAGRGPGDIIVSNADAEPWNQINHFDTLKIIDEAGLKLLTLSQSLSIAYQISQQDENWTGGKVGEGDIYQGLHLGNVDEPQPASAGPDEGAERRWHVLPNGERIYDFAGNLWQRLFDDLHGDEQGLVRKEGIPLDDIAFTLPPFPSEERGTGWRYSANKPTDWSGGSLIRGGSWFSGSDAGVFALYGCDPYWTGDLVGFRCTKPAGL